MWGSIVVDRPENKQRKSIPPGRDPKPAHSFPLTHCNESQKLHGEVDAEGLGRNGASNDSLAVGAVFPKKSSSITLRVWVTIVVSGLA
jgi:hypothetical protein